MNPDLCAAATTPGLVADLLANTDCQASSLVERGYTALSTPGAATAAVLTSLMVIAVALYGYRLLLGKGLALSDVTGLAIRLGVVLLLAASWSSFQALAYDAFARAPSRIASELVVAIDAPAPLDGVQSALDRIEKGNVGWRTRAGIASPMVGGAPTAAMALNVSSFLLTLSTVGLLVVSRILLALLLAITPVMAGFLLFDATRGLLEGWLRALTGAALVPLFVLILCAIELAILSPLLDRMLADQASGQFELDTVTPVALVVIVFSIAIVASARAATMIARGIRLPRKGFASNPSVAAPISPSSPVERPLLLTGPRAASTPVARALESAARRDAEESTHRTVAAAMRGSREVSSSTATTGNVGSASRSSESVGRPYLPPPRTRLPRASRAAARRDL
ncbi:type IV secretion system protein [Sphingomonas sp.]|uniref:type IV secretion system protein n=1 Tax=Sphingomonas sp. TaxID=28214 RepID=UPI00286BE9CC|nr:type IV secretion system protein [Sphingomonas sp.]